MESEKVKLAVHNINTRLRELRAALYDAVKDGLQSASVSNGGASQSFTRMNVNDLRQAIADLESAKASLLAHGKRKCISPNFTYGH
jgi:hypothetical protein